MSEIAFRNVCKQFDSEHYVVKDFNLDIHDKEFLIFVGPSGCGYSCEKHGRFHQQIHRRV